MFRKQQNTITYIFYKKHLYKKHQTEILFKIITIQALI